MTNTVARAILILALWVTTAACGAGEQAGHGRTCESVKIIEAALSDPALLRYANSYFKARGPLVVLWDVRSRPQTGCDLHGRTFSVKQTLDVDTSNNGRYVVIDKMYYDGDAAFMTLQLLPTGMRGDLFLRKSPQWHVTQHNFWER